MSPTDNGDPYSIYIDDENFSWDTGEDSDYMTSESNTWNQVSVSSSCSSRLTSPGPLTSPQSFVQSPSVNSQPQPQSENDSEVILPPPFSTPPKLRTVETVLKDYKGKDVSTLRVLTVALAREAIFGRKEMARSSLSGRKNTALLDSQKLDYIKTLVRSRVSEKSQVEFEAIWTLCRSSLSKSCQTLRTTAKKDAL